MRSPDGVAHASGKVLRLKGSLYGLKQSARVWWIALGTALDALGLRRLGSDWGLYYKSPSKEMVRSSFWHTSTT